MEIIDFIAGFEAVVGFGILFIVAVGAMFISRKHIKAVNRSEKKN